MNGSSGRHPSDDSLRAYGLGKLDDAAGVVVGRHVEVCAECRGRVSEMTSDSFLGRLREAGVGPVVGEGAGAGSSLTGMSMAGGGGTAPVNAGTLPPGLPEHSDYEMLRELGRGGMGVVYLAQNTLMGRPEVLKVVGSHLISRPGVLDRFLREIRAAAKLHHPNIVTAYSALRMGDSLVLTMEYVEGLDLSKMVKAKGPLPVTHACNFIYQAARGLQHAHERGMVHRDIKPANLIVARNGKRAVVKVLDFGLAKVAIEDAGDHGLTREGQMLGTPDYIAPEQIRNAQAADIRADIYSLGCTLYYLLTGAAPFRGDNLWDLYQAHFSMDATPLNLARPEVPVELAALVGKMMAKDRDRRFQTPDEVAQALEPLFREGVSSGSREISVAGPSVLAGASVVEPGRGPTVLEGGTQFEVRPSQSGTIAEAPLASSAGSAVIDSPFTILVTEDFGELRSGSVGSKSRVGTGGRALVVATVAGALGVAVLGAILAIGVKNGSMDIMNAEGGPSVKAAGGSQRKDEARKTPAAREAIEKKALPPAGNDLTASIASNSSREAGGTAPAKSSSVSPPVAAKSPTVPPTVVPVVSKPSEASKAVNDVAKVAQGREGKPPVSTNMIGMKFALIPEGSFLMGSADPNGPVEERPQHKVTISTPFYLGLTEVTQAQYSLVMGTNPSHFSATGAGKEVVAGRPTGDYPVEQVSWLDAVEFCNKLSWRDRLPLYYRMRGEAVDVPNGKGLGYRLPTEAEWEYVFREARPGPLPPGEPLVEYGWFSVNSNGSTHPVGTKRPNALGLYDLHGNVFEWCSDQYSIEYYKNAPEVDPLGPVGMSTRIARGTGWRSRQRFNLTTRMPTVPTVRHWQLGFRVARGYAATGRGGGEAAKGKFER
jgi:serine/threonine protein kinase/formylglycine-generating enzyme required for sulfatase activity